MRLSPANKFKEFLPFEKKDLILDFGLKETELYEAKNLSKWLNVKKCYLKLETTNPTKTVKDRITELTYSFFYKNKIKNYSHSSTGNTGTSLVWGLEKYINYCPNFRLHIFIPEEQYPYHNFKNVKGLKVYLLEKATYDEAKKFNKWFAKKYFSQNEILSYTSEFRQKANKLPYLEAFYQLKNKYKKNLYVAQAISSGTGLIGAYLAAQDAVNQGWLEYIPSFIAAQPEYANPIVKCYNSGLEKYNEKFTITKPKKSKAWAIRRGDASGCYDRIYNLLSKNNGLAISCNEKEIIQAKKALEKIENINSGYTASVAIAGVKKLNHNLKNSTILIMITGADRKTNIKPKIDEIIKKEKWKKIISKN
ncbi:MAG: pyridoxal-phosphate dependent enzyme [Candidatus Woesearchaeota archaeon]